jgi:hypothetical protein
MGTWEPQPHHVLFSGVELSAAQEGKRKGEKGYARQVPQTACLHMICVEVSVLGV